MWTEHLPRITPISALWSRNAQDMRQPTVSFRIATHSTSKSCKEHLTLHWHSPSHQSYLAAYHQPLDDNDVLNTSGSLNVKE